MIRFTEHYQGQATDRPYVPGETATLSAEAEAHLVSLGRAVVVEPAKAPAPAKPKTRGRKR